MSRTIMGLSVVAVAACASPPPGVQTLHVVNQGTRTLQIQINRATLEGAVVRAQHYERLGLTDCVILTALDGDTIIERVATVPLLVTRDLIWFVGGLGRRRLVDYAPLYSSRPGDHPFGISAEDLTEVLGSDGQHLIEVPRGALVLDVDTALPRPVERKANLDRRSVLRVEDLTDDADEGRATWVERVKAEQPSWTAP